MPKDYVYSPIPEFDQENQYVSQKDPVDMGDHYFVGIEVKTASSVVERAVEAMLIDMEPTMTRDQYLDKMVAEQKIDSAKLDELKKQFAPVNPIDDVKSL